MEDKDLIKITNEIQDQYSRKLYEVIIEMKKKIEAKDIEEKYKSGIETHMYLSFSLFYLRAFKNLFLKSCTKEKFLDIYNKYLSTNTLNYQLVEEKTEMKTKTQISATIDKKIYRRMEKLRKKRIIKLKRSAFIELAIAEKLAEMEVELQNKTKEKLWKTKI